MTTHGAPQRADTPSLAIDDIIGLVSRGHHSSYEAYMITEIALFDLKPGMEMEFEVGIRSAIPLFKRARGLKEFRVHRSIEKPSRYRLLIKWETVESHTVDFRGSQDYQEFRKLVSHCYAAPPDVEHVDEIAVGFQL